jgi:hypothetical protein
VLEFDTSLQRKFKLTEKARFELRATAYNLANHPIYSNPSGNTSSSSFGRISSNQLWRDQFRRSAAH